MRQWTDQVAEHGKSRHRCSVAHVIGSTPSRFARQSVLIFKTSSQ